MKCYDKSKIGRLIGAGSEHIVFDYENNQVIKFSIIASIVGKNKGPNYLNRDLLICKKYFGKYVLDTNIITSKNRKIIAEIQTKITKRYLEVSDMKNPLIYKQFSEIINNYKKLISDGHPAIDFVGGIGVLKGDLSNIFVTESNRLMIIDTTLLGADNPFWLKLFLATVKIVIMPIQKRRIKKFLNAK